MTVKIDKGVPMPTPITNAIWPWKEMEPGDSFFAAGYVQSTKQRTEPKEKLMNPWTMGPRIVPGSTWAGRLVTENGVRGVRVWRVT